MTVNVILCWALNTTAVFGWNSPFSLSNIHTLIHTHTHTHTHIHIHTHPLLSLHKILLHFLSTAKLNDLWTHFLRSVFFPLGTYYDGKHFWDNFFFLLELKFKIADIMWEILKSFLEILGSNSLCVKLHYEWICLTTWKTISTKYYMPL